MSTLDQDHSYGFALLTPVGVGDLNRDASVPTGFDPGQAFFARSPWGIRMYKSVQNRHTALVVKGALLRAYGGNTGYTQITTSGAAAANTKLKATTSGLTAGVYQGAGFYVQNSVAGAGVAPEGEDAVVAGNSTTEVFIEPGMPLTAVVTPGDFINLHSVYAGEVAAVGDLAYAVLGVVVGANGISVGNYGFVAVHGYTPNTLVKAATAMGLGEPIIADVGRVASAAVAGTAAANLHLGTFRHAVQADSVSDKTSVLLTLGLGYNPGTADAT